MTLLDKERRVSHEAAMRLFYLRLEQRRREKQQMKDVLVFSSLMLFLCLLAALIVLV